MRDAQLQTLIEKALNAWPGLIYAGGRNSRAHAAADLVERGRVKHLGGDVFNVDGYHVQAEADICDCEDHNRQAPSYPKVGRLCKHRVAARMYRVWGGERNEQLLAAIRSVIDRNGLAFARLRFEWDYDTNRRWLVGYEAAGQRVRWAAGSPERVEFTWLQLRWAMNQVGWGVDRLPQKDRWYEYTLAIRPGRGIEINETTMNVQGTTEVMIERAKAEKDLLETLARDGNHVGITLSERTARRVWYRRAELAAA